MWSIGRSEWCKGQIIVHAIGALPISLKSYQSVRPTPNYISMPKHLSKFVGEHSDWAQHTGSARDLTPSGSSPQPISDQN